MKRSTRYSLIVVGFISFLILAPLLVFYVSGRTIELDSVGNQPTGLLDAKSNPSGAMLLIDGKEHSSTPAIARFLNQGEYVITLSHEGYYDWSKRLPIESSKVTYAQEGVTEVQLIKKSDPVTLVPAGVSSFILVDDVAWYIQGNNLIGIDIDDTDSVITIPLGFRAPYIMLLRDRSHTYVGKNTIVNLNTRGIIKVTPKLGIELDPYATAITPNGSVVYLQNNSLYIYDPTTGNNSLVPNQVLAFTMIGSSGYFLGPNSIEVGYWNGRGFQDNQTLLDKLNIKGGINHLYITDNKELFCHCGGDLFRVGNELELINGGVNSVNLDLTTNELSFTTASELWFYNFLAAKPQLLIRGGGGSVSTFLIRSSLGYGFVGNERGLSLIEIDTRDKQNNYYLLQGSQVWQIGISNNQKTIVVLQDGSLKSLEIRN